MTEAEKEVRDILIQQGREARKLGLPISACPPFKIKDMTINWQMGWRWEDEDIAKGRSNSGMVRHGTARQG